MVSCGMIHGLNFGLMTIIDYRGYRLLATSRLPISQQTLVYGSGDGGHTVHSDMAEMNGIIKQCAAVLNIKVRTVHGSYSIISC
jgi:alpha-mannosidase